MFFYLITWAFYSDLVLAASLPRPSESVDSLAAGPVSSLNLLSPANTLALSSNNSSPGNVLKIACDATKYGKNLKVNSCRNVFRFLRRDETRYTFAERDSGVPHDVPLPLRTLSSKTPHRRLDLLDTAPSYLACKYHPSYSDVAGDGLCFVQPILKKDAISGYATSTEIGQAAFTMLQTCVIERGMGGMAFNIGGDNNINIAIADYKPNIKCDSTSTPGPSWNSCVGIFANMRATKQARIFGYPEDPGVQEKLPLILEGADRKCQASIDIEGPATLATWYELWEAVTAVASMCVRQKGKGGKAKNLGIGKNIRLELLESKQEPGKLGNISTVSLPEAGVAVQDFDAESSRGGMTAFDGDVPFELLMGVVQHKYDNSSLVTLPGRNDSVMGS